MGLYGNKEKLTANNYGYFRQDESFENVLSLHKWEKCFINPIYKIYTYQIYLFVKV